MIICNFFKNLLIHPPNAGPARFFVYSKSPRMRVQPFKGGQILFFYENFSSNLFQNVDFQIFECGFKIELGLLVYMPINQAVYTCWAGNKQRKGK